MTEELDISFVVKVEQEEEDPESTLSYQIEKDNQQEQQNNHKPTSSCLNRKVKRDSNTFIPLDNPKRLKINDNDGMIETRIYKIL